MVKHVNSKIAILGSHVFFIFQISFSFKRAYQWLQDFQGNFLNVNFARKHFFKLIKNGKNRQFEPKLSKNGYSYFLQFCL